MSIGKGGRDGNITYSPPSNKIQHFVLKIHERAVEVIVEFLVRTNQPTWLLHAHAPRQHIVASQAMLRVAGRAAGAV